MCAGPVKNLIDDATGATARKDAEQNAAKAAAERQRQMDEVRIAEEAEAQRLADLAKKKQDIIDNAAAERENIETTLGNELSNIKETNDDLIDTLISNATTNRGGGGGRSGPSSSELAAASGAAQASQSVLNRERKKKKKGALKIPYSPSKRKEGNRGPRSTKADLQIEGQTQATGTGTNLAI